MALLSGQFHRRPSTFHALIVVSSGLYLTGIPVFEFLHEQEGWFLLVVHIGPETHCLPLYHGPAMSEMVTVMHTLNVCAIAVPPGICDFAIATISETTTHPGYGCNFTE